MYKLKELALLIGAELDGDPEITVARARPFDFAGEGDVTYAAAPGYMDRVPECPAAAVIVPRALLGSGGNLLIAESPKLAFARAILALHTNEPPVASVSPDLVVGEGGRLGRDLTIHPRVTIGRDCDIGDRVVLYPGVVIGDRCKIGAQTVIYPNVSIYNDSEIGSRVIIHAGAVIGADGFGFVPDEDGRQVKILQLGFVKIEDDCEIGANCAIDRGAFDATVLKRGVKLDNLIQVGHNSEIGEDTVVAALTGFSGGTKTGRQCVIAGQVGTQQHITIGDRAIITARAGVTKNVRAGAVIAGMAQDYNSWRRSQAVYARLPEISRRLRRLEARVEPEQDNPCEEGPEKR